MTFKSIDLQTSLPRTAELSPLAQQQNHRQASEQAHLALQSFKTAEQQAQRPAQTESAQKGQISDRQKREDGRQPSRERKRDGEAAQEQDKRAAHPFKGKHIDFTG